MLRQVPHDEFKKIQGLEIDLLVLVFEQVTHQCAQGLD